MSSLWHILSWADGCTPGSLCDLLPALTHPCWYTSTTSGTLVVEVLKGFTVILFQDPRYLSSSALLLRVNHIWSVFICYMVSLNGWVVGGWGGVYPLHYGTLHVSKCKCLLPGGDMTRGLNPLPSPPLPHDIGGCLYDSPAWVLPDFVGGVCLGSAKGVLPVCVHLKEY